MTTPGEAAQAVERADPDWVAREAGRIAARQDWKVGVYQPYPFYDRDGDFVRAYAAAYRYGWR